MRFIFNVLTGLSLLLLGLVIIARIIFHNYHPKAHCTLRWSENENHIHYNLSVNEVQPWGFHRLDDEYTLSFLSPTFRSGGHQTEAREELLKYGPADKDLKFSHDGAPDFSRLWQLTPIRTGSSGGMRVLEFSSLAGWFSVLPALRIFFRIRRWWSERKMRENGCCKNCGYDLRATPDRCPECGLVPKPVEM